jgi:hypothetical protein
VANTNMKAVLTLTADASGVSVGINRALKDLERLQKGVQDIRSFAVAGALSNLFSGLSQGVMQELNRLGELGRTYSPEGMAASNDLSIAQQQSGQALGEAFGPITALIDQTAAAHLKELTQYLIDNRDKIGEAMMLVAEFGMALSTITAEALVAFGELAEYVHALLDNPVETIADTATGAAASMIPGGSGGALLTMTGAIYDALMHKLGGD